MKYICRKLVLMAGTVLALSFLVFLAFRLIPGDPALMILGGQTDPARVEALREEMGLNDPILVQYGRWLWDFLRGNFGMSYKYGVSVGSLIGSKIPITLWLTLEALLLMLLISVPLGVYTAKHAGGAADRAIMVLNQIIMAVPPFFTGILFTWLFGMLFHLFTPGGYIDYKTDFAGFLGYLFFPALSIALPKCAMVVKLLRSSVLQQSRKEYVRTAYSRGSTTGYVLFRHVLRNASGPVITFWGMAAADMAAGSVVIEQVFSIPGLGRALLTSIGNRDYPVVEAVIVIIAVIVVVCNGAADLVLRRVDPRISQE